MIDKNDKSQRYALDFAEGWLSHPWGGHLSAGLAGARFEGYRGLARWKLALEIARDMKRRGLKPGFDLGEHLEKKKLQEQ